MDKHLTNRKKICFLFKFKHFYPTSIETQVFKESLSVLLPWNTTVFTQAWGGGGEGVRGQSQS